MLLVLDERGGGFGARLAGVAKAIGLPSLILCPAQLAHETSIRFSIDARGVELRLRNRETTVEAHELRAAYCGIETFSPATWPAFSRDDAEYAARETHALWLAILASLPCPVVNPPALDALGGTALAVPELLVQARRVGLRVPSVATVESGAVADAVLSAAAVASVADLGEPFIAEHAAPPRGGALRRVPNEVRLTEHAAGSPVHVALVGARAFVSAPDAAGVPRPLAARELPRGEGTRLRRLQRALRLHAGEYAFAVDRRERWTLTGATRPPRAAALAHGDALFEAVLDRTRRAAA